MCTLLRLAAILVVTGAVAAGIYLLVRATPSNQGRESASAGERLRGGPTGEWSHESRGRGRGEFARQRERAWNERDSTSGRDAGDGQGPIAASPRAESSADGERSADGQRRPGRESRDGREGHGERGEFSPGRGSAGLLITTLQVGVVAAVVAGLQGRSRRKAKAAKAGAGKTADEQSEVKTDD